ncbi:hypothetical protein FHS15_002582 [Paenibacillus castaneae]|uniref:hypothetical protein n=1 Tax=Paenibacillus castaneae TaxID=474957 RepID=UPI001FBBBB4B|nr:hypothetical protein [Paenibacillus castaneae]NIK77446.1 hypothetical protein [Paenibacillus castaneae]
MSRMPSRWNVWTIAFMVLLVIGVVYSIIQTPIAYTIIPIVVLGGIFLLYKYPPSFLKGYGSQGRPQVKQSRATAAKTRSKTNKPRSKTVPFRVIEGGKDDDDLPKYH